jgi:hypothetical protein
MKNLAKNFIIIFVVLFLVAGAISLLDFGKEEPDIIGVSRLIEEINNEKIESINVQGDLLVINLHNEEANEQNVKK